MTSLKLDLSMFPRHQRAAMRRRIVADLAHNEAVCDKFRRDREASYKAEFEQAADPDCECAACLIGGNQ